MPLTLVDPAPGRTRFYRVRGHECGIYVDRSTGTTDKKTAERLRKQWIDEAWIADRAGNLLELHLVGRKQCIVTVWRGGAKELDDIRAQFAERVAGFEDSPYQAAGILLQLLLGTLDYVTQSLDVSLDDLRLCVDRTSRSDDFAMLTQRLRALQSRGLSFNRYSSAVRSATVGIEALSGMDARGAAELNDYVEQVEDIGEQLDQRRKWMSNIMHDFATNIAEKQGEQINRLTLVSLFFLPVTALTGFFGMNFDWMVRSLSGGEAFVVLGILLPALCVGLTFAWLVRWKLVRFRLWPERIRRRHADASGRIQRRGAVERADRGGSFHHWPPAQIPRVVRDQPFGTGVTR
jgi:Mg2+ and Co2+ transporter CorA